MHTLCGIYKLHTVCGALSVEHRVALGPGATNVRQCNRCITLLFCSYTYTRQLCLHAHLNRWIRSTTEETPVVTATSTPRMTQSLHGTGTNVGAVLQPQSEAPVHTGLSTHRHALSACRRPWLCDLLPVVSPACSMPSPCHGLSIMLHANLLCMACAPLLPEQHGAKKMVCTAIQDTDSNQHRVPSKGCSPGIHCYQVGALGQYSEESYTSR